jgi:hypothetical protein
MNRRNFFKTAGAAAGTVLLSTPSNALSQSIETDSGICIGTEHFTKEDIENMWNNHNTLNVCLDILLSDYQSLRDNGKLDDLQHFHKRMKSTIENIVVHLLQKHPMRAVGKWDNGEDYIPLQFSRSFIDSIKNKS